MAVLPTNHMVLTRPRPRARPRCWRGTRCRRRAGPRRPPGGCSPWPRAGGWRPGPRWCWAGRSLGPCPEQCHRYQTLLLCRQRRRHSITEPPQFPTPVPAASSMPALLQSINSFSTKRNRFLHFLQKLSPQQRGHRSLGVALVLSIRFNDTGGMEHFQKMIIMIIFRFGQNKLEN